MTPSQIELIHQTCDPSNETMIRHGKKIKKTTWVNPKLTYDSHDSIHDVKITL